MTELRTVDSLVAYLAHLYHKLGLSHLGYVAILIVYSIIGGLIFQHFELENDLLSKSNGTDKGNNYQLYQQTLVRLSEKIDLLQRSRLKLSERKEEYLREFESFAQLIGITAPSNSHEDIVESHWSLPGAIFYAGLYTATVGDTTLVRLQNSLRDTLHNYRLWQLCSSDNNGPSGYNPLQPIGLADVRIIFVLAGTTNFRRFLLGIPLVLTILNDLGKVLFQVMKFIWTGFSRLLWRRRRKGGDFTPLGGAPDPEDTDLPISGAIMVFWLWMTGCAGIFKLLEPDWSFFDAFYFSFISLTTIGKSKLTCPHENPNQRFF